MMNDAAKLFAQHFLATILRQDGEENFVDDEGRAVTSGPLQEAVKSPRGASALERQTLQAAMDANLRELERMDKRVRTTVFGLDCSEIMAKSTATYRKPKWLSSA